MPPSSGLGRLNGKGGYDDVEWRYEGNRSSGVKAEYEAGIGGPD